MRLASKNPASSSGIARRTGKRREQPASSAGSRANGKRHASVEKGTAMKRTALVLLLLAQGAAALEWVQLHPEGEAPVPRSNAAAIYDPAGHRVVLFGGLRAGGDLNDVWELGLAPPAWRKITPDSGPAPDTRWSHNAVYDPAGHQMLVWSGRHLGDFFNDVWAFDLDEHTWRQFTPETRPAFRYGTASIFDLRAGRLVSFAGFTDLGRFDDTWAFDPAASVWTDISTDPRPLARCLHTAAYDPVGYRMLIFGGQGGRQRPERPVVARPRQRRLERHHPGKRSRRAHLRRERVRPRDPPVRHFRGRRERGPRSQKRRYLGLRSRRPAPGPCCNREAPRRRRAAGRPRSTSRERAAPCSSGAPRRSASSTRSGPWKGWTRPRWWTGAGVW